MLRRALVRLVDDHRVVAAHQRIAADLGEQQAVGDQTDQGVPRAAIVETDRVTDRPAERYVELVGDPLRHGARREPPRLGVGDGPAHAPAELEAELGQLRRLARPGLPGHDHDLVIGNRGEQVVATRGHRQLRRIGDRGDRRAPSLHPRLRLRQLVLEARVALVVAPAEPVSLAAKALLVAQRQLAERRLVDECHLPDGHANGGHPDRE